MRILIFGAGAIGSLVGGLLSANNEVVLVAREPHVKAIHKDGLRISGDVRTLCRPRAVTSVRGLEGQDLVIVTTKAFDSKHAIEEIGPIVTERTVVLSLQNGMNNIDIFPERFGARGIIALTSMGVTFEGAGTIRCAGKGETVVGGLAGANAYTDLVIRELEASGISARASKDIRADVWMKALVNATINPITALTGSTNGCIIERPCLRELARNIVEEGSLAAERNGIVLPCTDPLSLVLDTASRTRGNRSSMLQDISMGKRTEIEEITGALIAAGERKGVPMPVNTALWTLVRSIRPAT